MGWREGKLISKRADGWPPGWLRVSQVSQVWRGCPHDMAIFLTLFQPVLPGPPRRRLRQLRQLRQSGVKCRKRRPPLKSNLDLFLSSIPEWPGLDVAGADQRQRITPGSDYGRI